MGKGWGGHVTWRDYEVLALIFGFKDAKEMKQFADEQHAKVMQRALR